MGDALAELLPNITEAARAIGREAENGLDSTTGARATYERGPGETCELAARWHGSQGCRHLGGAVGLEPHCGR